MMSEQVTTTLVRSNTVFAFDLYRAISEQSGNLFFSPLSISAALAMAYAGARGETAAEMEQVLHLAAEPDQTHAAFAALDEIVAGIQEAGLVRLDTANSLWPHANYPLLAEYLHLVERYYGTMVTAVDYRDGPAAAQRINHWVEQKTQGRITALVGPDLDPLTRLLLVNAIYFKGKWDTPFDRERTDEHRFWLGRSNSVTAPMMRRTGTFRFAQVDGLQVLELPYASDELFMLVLLPRSRTGLGGLERELTAASFEGWCESLRLTHAEVLLPRFRLTRDFELSQALMALGMRDAFDASRADFSGMDGRRRWLYVSQVIHKAFIDVDEQGTEAAAATAIRVTGRSAFLPLEKLVVFRADHPFLLAIRERSSGTILFLGRVANPVA